MSTNYLEIENIYDKLCKDKYMKIGVDAVAAELTPIQKEMLEALVTKAYIQGKIDCISEAIK